MRIPAFFSLFVLACAPPIAPTLPEVDQAEGVVPGQWIVLTDNPDESVALAGGKVRPLHTYYHAIHGWSFQGDADAAREIAGQPGVRAVVPDLLVHAQSQTVPTGIRRIGATANSLSQIDGVDDRVAINVAIIDTGIDTTHPDLNVVGGVDCIPTARARPIPPGAPAWIDGHGHGTHVAGTVGAMDNDRGVVGVAPGVRLWAVRVLGDSGSGTLSSVICGMDWVTGTRRDADTRNDIAVANLSLGVGGIPDDGNCGNTIGDPMHQALCRMVAAGVVPVVAAGNSADDAGNSAPSSYREAVTVSAFADTDGQPGGLGGAGDDTFAWFSNWGPAVDVAAPGVGILSTCPDWIAPTPGGFLCEASGTSMAAPHVTGAMALYFAANPLATDAAGVTAAERDFLGTGGAYVALGDGDAGFTGDPDGIREPVLSVGETVAVTGITVQSEVTQGGSAPVAVALRNRSAVDVSAVLDLVDRTAGVTLSSVTVALGAGESRTISLVFSPTVETLAGPHRLAAVSGRSSAAATVTVRGVLRDLAVQSLVAPAVVFRGKPETVTASIQNKGAVAENATVVLRIGASTLATASVTLQPGATAPVTFAVNPDDGVAAGAATLAVEALALTGETALANNVRSRVITVRAPVRDFAVTGLTIPAVRVNAAVSVTVVVKNLGTLSQSGTVTLTDVTGGVTVGSGTVTINPGASANISFVWTAPAAPGNRTFSASVAALAGETALANNVRTLAVAVRR